MPELQTLASNTAGAGWLTLLVPLGFLLVVLAIAFAVARR